MAEALGVAASGITVAQVAAQVGKSIIKLKQLWDDFKDVPSSIGDLLDQIDCLDPALWEAENTFSQASLPPMFWDSSLGSRSTTYCRKALSSLTELVDELTLQLNRPGKFRSKVAVAKAVLKKEQLGSLERRLQNAITMLSLAQRCYLIALTKLQPHIIIRKIMETKMLQDDIQQGRSGVFDAHQQQISSQTIKLADNEQFEVGMPIPRRRMKRQQDTVSSMRFRLPTWLCRATWELQSFRSYGNWQFNLRYYHTVPKDSELFYTAEFGTPKDLQILFAGGRASPYDRDDYDGDTLLHRAVWGLNRPMVKYLLDIGLSPLEVDHNGYTPIGVFSKALFSRDLVSILADWSFADELTKLSDDLDSESRGCNCYVGLISKESWKKFKCLECPWHEDTTLESRLRSLGRALVVHPIVIPDLLRQYWTQDLRALCIESVATFPLIHIVARGLGNPDDSVIVEWASLADTIISNTPNIHHIHKYQETVPNQRWTYSPRLTPLMALIKPAVHSCEFGGFARKGSGRLNLWLSKVQSSGYDLEEYGRRENELLMDKELELDNVCVFLRYDRQREAWERGIDGCIRGYQYGPEPKDWKILWSFPEKSYAADFWRLVEDGSQLVPGAVSNSRNRFYSGHTRRMMILSKGK
ncbi:hypothetical protein F4803DRAFT_508744 [Xylaria telfairii]|nr:hypothetical protein F4803DRAFT_508744 [Xylaria telfairii]